tara:strand:+ start:40314 stop:41204 length:891 start_codon:yes stop_codon:yes gene_type:complete
MYNAVFFPATQRLMRACCLFTSLLACGLATAQNADAAHDRQGRIKGTGAVSSITGASGGGLIPWATLGTYASDGQQGINVFATRVELDDYRLDVTGGAVNFGNRAEVAYARQNFRINAADLDIRQDKASLRYRLAGDIIYGNLPQITAGMEYGRLRDKAVARSVGATHTSGTDYVVSMGKAWLDGIAHRTTLLNVNVRYGDSNQYGILGYGGDVSGSKLTAELAAAVFINRSVAVGMEFRQKSDYLSALREDNARDMFVAWIPNKNISVTLAWVDLGDIAGAADQRGIYLSLQGTL